MITHASQGPLDVRTVLRFFSPLALSWVFMALEGPIAATVIGIGADPKLNMAAMLVVMSLALWIESPVIDLLSTATTLANSHENYRQIRKFVLHIMGWITVIHALFVLTPAYDAVALGVLQLPADVAAAARPALVIMIPWSACIGWRRYLQGILIRHGQTRRIGAGTLLRLGVMCGSAALLTAFIRWPSIQIVAAALIMSVFVEALFVHWASRPVLRWACRDAPPQPRLDMRRLAAFHFPLTGTTMVMFLAQPLISAALARSPDAIVSMAGWQTAFTVMWLMRAAVYALPEVVITLRRDADSHRFLRRFCIGVGASSSALLGILWLTGASHAYFEAVTRGEPNVVATASLAFVLGLALPMIGALQSFVRGCLTQQSLTTSRFVAIFVYIGVLQAGLMLGTALRAPGVLTAGLALTVAHTAELGMLAWFWEAAKRADAQNQAPRAG